MREINLLIALGLILLAFHFSGGCTTKSPENAQTVIPPAPASGLSTSEPDRMALQVSDVSSDYTRDYQAWRGHSDASEWEIDHGWRKGYVVRFNRTDPGSLDSSFIIQSISVYSPDAIRAVLPMADLEYRRAGAEDGGIEVLPYPGIGEDSRATRLTAPGKNITGKVTIATSLRNYSAYSIDFVKKDVYERVTIYGTMPDYAFLKEITRKAADKIT